VYCNHISGTIPRGSLEGLVKEKKPRRHRSAFERKKSTTGSMGEKGKEQVIWGGEAEAGVTQKKREGRN